MTPQMVFIGVTQEGKRQREAHIEETSTTMLHIGWCGYGWAGNADLYTLNGIEAAINERHASGWWMTTEPTPIAWVQICPRCTRALANRPTY